jgi:hypothetical protein
VCCRSGDEPDSSTCYRKELYETPNVHPIGSIMVNSSEYRELIRRCAYVMQVFTKEAGIDTEDFGIRFSDDSLEEIKAVVTPLPGLPENWHRRRSMRVREVAEEKYSEEAFMDRWRSILRDILDGEGMAGDA